MSVMKYRSETKVRTTSFYDRFASWYDTFVRLAFPPGEKGRERVVAETVKGSDPPRVSRRPTYVRPVNMTGASSLAK